MPPGVGQPVDGLDEIVLGAREAVQQQRVQVVRGSGLGDLEDQTGRLDPAQLHQRPPVSALRSTTWSAGGSVTCTGTPKSNRSRVNVTDPGRGVVVETFVLLRSTVYFMRRTRPWASTHTSTGCVEEPSSLMVDLIASLARGDRAAALFRSTTAR